MGYTATVTRLHATSILARTPLALAACLALVACTGEQQGTYKHGALPKPADKTEQKADVAAGQAQKADAKADAKAAPVAAAETASLSCADEKVDPKVQELCKTFHKGALARPGMTPLEVAAYNVAQGDPTGGTFTLKQALAGDPALEDPSKGKLYADFHTTMGDFSCELFEDKVPGTIANFVGLARGTRPWFDKMEDKWMTGPYYDGVVFHRVVRGFMNQTGDRQGTGRGSPGFVVVDEFDKTLRHKGPGILSMANRGPNTGSSQFFITVKSTPHLDNKHAVFGKCGESKVITAINEARVQGERPIETIKINTIDIVRR